MRKTIFEKNGKFFGIFHATLGLPSPRFARGPDQDLAGPENERNGLQTGPFPWDNLWLADMPLCCQQKRAQVPVRYASSRQTEQKHLVLWHFFSNFSACPISLYQGIQTCHPIIPEIVSQGFF